MERFRRTARAEERAKKARLPSRVSYKATSTQTRFQAHAEAVLSALKLDPLDYFAVQSSFKDKIGEPKVFTERWIALRGAQARRDWLEMISILGGNKKTDYPPPETIDACVAQFLQTECRIQFQKSFVPNLAPHVCRFYVSNSAYLNGLLSAQFRILSTHAFYGNYGNSLFEFKPSEAPFIICNSNAPDFPNLNNGAGMGPGFSEMEVAERARRGEISMDDAKQKSIRIVKDAAETLDRWLDSH